MALGCYTEPYLPASFKGVPFVAMEATSTHGRRGAEGEFPFGENTAYADLGRKIRTYTLEGRFQTNLHTLEAAAFIAACESTGPGVLTHPTRGVILSAACRSLTVRDRVEEEAGVTYVEVEFVEANDWPNGLSLLGQLLGLALGAIIGASRSHYSATYAPDDIQPFRREAVVQSAQDRMADIASEYAQATANKSDDLSRNRILNDLAVLVEDDTVAADVATMDRGLALGMNALANELEGRNKFDVFRRLANQAALTSTYNTPASTSENAIFANVRVIAAAYMAEGSLEEQSSRTGQVYEELDAIDALLASEQSYAYGQCANELYAAISDFRTTTVAQLYAKAYEAPGLVSYDFGGGVHPLVASYSVFNDAKRHRELERYNNVGRGGRFGAGVIAPRGA